MKEGEPRHLEWMGIPGREQSKCGGTKERTCFMCLRNSKGIGEAGLEWEMGRHI